MRLQYHDKNIIIAFDIVFLKLFCGEEAYSDRLNILRTVYELVDCFLQIIKSRLYILF